MKMFDHRHYVPVLRWKRAEWIALRHVHPRDRVRITPLIEPVPLASDPEALQKHGNFTTGLPEVAKELEKSWGGHQPIFVDFVLWDSPLKTKGTHPLETFWKSVSGRWLEPICVTGLHRSEAYQRQMAEIAAACGTICLRLTAEDVQVSDLTETVDKLLSNLTVEPARTHLVVDYRDHWPMQYVYLCQVLPFLESWRTFTVLSGSFPRDLQSFKVGQHLHPRREWLSWRSQVAKSAFLPRKPTFGDYTTEDDRVVMRAGSSSVRPDNSCSTRSPRGSSFCQRVPVLPACNGLLEGACGRREWIHEEDHEGSDRE